MSFTAYYYGIMSQRRVYIITEGHEPVRQEVHSSLRKVAKEIEEDLSYHALSQRLQRAKARTGKSIVRIKDKEGNPITVEIREIK